MSELFIELSDQQQELVAGGYYYLPANFSLNNNSHTTFSQDIKMANAVGGSASGPVGSAAGGAVTAVYDSVYTSGNNYQNVQIP